MRKKTLQVAWASRKLASDQPLRGLMKADYRVCYPIARKNHQKPQNPEAATRFPLY